MKLMAIFVAFLIACSMVFVPAINADGKSLHKKPPTKKTTKKY
uniref:Venom peptide n=1 Tax=Meloidogyne hapla TaxID=6305 RepID=A0A1I8BQJ6_MELHA